MIALLGWGSLIWDTCPKFDDQRENWSPDGPSLKLEFSRISTTRDDALTLVIDDDNGEECVVQYAMSKRRNPDDAICDLRCRERTLLKRIGYYFADGSQSCKPDVPETIKTWTAEKGFDVVVWTGLTSNFHDVKKIHFSVNEAISHLKALPPERKGKAKEYVSLARDFIDTPLRRALKNEPWFADKIGE